jgi:mannose-1-phosphate guanylyltransferase
MVTQAFILAAGLGTRLRPLTDELPKPLVPVFNKTLITFALDHLIAAGVQRFVINTHRLPHLFERTFATGNYREAAVKLIHEPELLETGGGIKNAERLLDGKAFLTYSGDILTDLDLRPLIDQHFQAGNDVTLALRETGLGAEIMFRDGRVLGFAGKGGARGNYDFANIAIWNSKAFSRFPAARKVSFIPVLAEWIRDGGRIGGVITNDGKWFNIGSVAEYLEVHRLIAQENWKPLHLREEWPIAVVKNAKVDASAAVLGFSAIAADCRVGAGARLIDTILWRGAQVAPGSEVRNCVVRAGKVAEGTLANAIV